MASIAQPAPLKILAVGPAVGSIRELLAKVKSIDAKHGKFELALCIGDFFGPPEVDAVSEDIEALLAGEIEGATVPVPTYVMQGDRPIPQSIIEKFANSGSEICHNLFLLTKSGFLTTSQGLRIACLGGIYDETIYTSTEAPLGFSDPYFSSQTVEKLLNNISATSSTVTSSSNSRLASLAALMDQHVPTHYVDILVSQTWPASITDHASSAPLGIDPNYLVPSVDCIVKRSKPRYHFATGAGVPQQFWEREPFAWPDDESRVTRFVSLGAFGGEHTSGKKPRWFYAFSITSPSAAPSATPANATANPFLSPSASSHAKRQVSMDEVENFIFEAVQQPITKKAKHDMREDGKPPSGYKCRICQSAEHFIQNCPERGKPPEGYVCKICNVPGHLIRDCPEKNALGDTGGRKPPPGYVCRACASENHYIQDCPVAAQSTREGGRRDTKGKQRGPPKEIGPNECWFCLSNPSVAKHLLVSIGEECYVTLPKGQIIPTAAVRHPAISKVPGGGHVLIVPITHYPTLSAMPLDLAVPIVAEVEQHKSTLRAVYAKHGCGAVAFEVGILSGRGGHAHVQVVPVPYALEPGKDVSRAVEDAFRREGATTGVVFEEDADAALQACAGGRANYFRVDLPDGGKMVHLIKQEVPFSIQFGRQVLCALLGVPERMDWKACGQSETEERTDAQAFKQAFTSFNLTQTQR